MDNGSEYVWLNVDEAEVAEVEVDKVTTDLWDQDDVFEKAYSSVPQQQQQAPPPPPLPSNAPTTAPPLPKPALKKRVVKKADTNVMSVNFGTLETGVSLATGDAIFCQQCKSVLSHMSIIKSNQESDQNSNNNGNSGQIWTCEFCGTQNDVVCDEAEIPKDESLDYILEAPSETSKSNLDEGLVIFCLDISGSMGISYEVQGKFQLKGHEKTSKLASLNQERNQFGQFAEQFLPNERRDVTYVTRLQCVQAAVSTEFERMSKENPNKRVCMITFNNEVNILGDGSTETVVVAGDKLFNYDQLFSIGSSYFESLKTPISQTVSKLNEKIFGIEETGATALGPALVVALGLASKSQGSKIVICTDGLTNTGLGSLDELYTDFDKERVATFYENIGLYSKAQGIVISVLSIKGQDCNLENLGRLADLTAGQVDRVDPLEINKNFQSILSLPVLATNVHAVLMLHKGLRFKQDNEDDIFAVKPENNSNEPAHENALTRFIGNVTKETEVTFEYGVKPNLKKEDFQNLDHLPFQLQIKYTRIDGMKCMRVISKKTPITFNRQVAEDKANIAVLGTNAVQQTAKIAAKGDYSGARFYNMSHKAMFNRVAKSEQQKTEFSAWSKHGRKLESTLVQAQQNEAQQGLFDDVMDAEFTSEAPSESLFENDDHQANNFDNFTFTSNNAPQQGSKPAPAPQSAKPSASVIRKNQRNDETSHMLYNMKSMNKKNMK